MSHWMTSGRSRLKARQNRSFANRAQQHAARSCALTVSRRSSNNQQRALQGGTGSASQHLLLRIRSNGMKGSYSEAADPIYRRAVVPASSPRSPGEHREGKMTKPLQQRRRRRIRDPNGYRDIHPSHPSDRVIIQALPPPPFSAQGQQHLPSYKYASLARGQQYIPFRSYDGQRQTNHHYHQKNIISTNREESENLKPMTNGPTTFQQRFGGVMDYNEFEDANYVCEFGGSSAPPWEWEDENDVRFVTNGLDDESVAFYPADRNWQPEMNMLIHDYDVQQHYTTLLFPTVEVPPGASHPSESQLGSQAQGLEQLLFQPPTERPLETRGLGPLSTQVRGLARSSSLSRNHPRNHFAICPPSMNSTAERESRRCPLGSWVSVPAFGNSEDFAGERDSSSPWVAQQRRQQQPASHPQSVRTCGKRRLIDAFLEVNDGIQSERTSQNSISTRKIRAIDPRTNPNKSWQYPIAFEKIGGDQGGLRIEEISQEAGNPPLGNSDTGDESLATLDHQRQEEGGEIGLFQKKKTEAVNESNGGRIQRRSYQRMDANEDHARVQSRNDRTANRKRENPYAKTNKSECPSSAPSRSQQRANCRAKAAVSRSRRILGKRDENNIDLSQCPSSFDSHQQSLTSPCFVRFFSDETEVDLQGRPLSKPSSLGSKSLAP